MFECKQSSPLAEHASVLIHRSPQAVFRFVGEQFFTNYPRWSPGVMELKQLGSGPMREGTCVRQVRVDVGHRTESIFAVTLYEPERRVCFEDLSRIYRCSFEMQEIASAFSTLIGFSFELLELDAHLRPHENQIREMIRNGTEQAVRNLKCLVEYEMTECHC